MLADLRIEEDKKRFLGDSAPAAVFCFLDSFIKQEPERVQNVVDGFFHAMECMKRSTAEEIADSVPGEYYLGNKAGFFAGLNASRPIFSKTYESAPVEMKRAFEITKRSDAKLRDCNLDLDETFRNRFIRMAKKCYPGFD